MKIWYCLLNYVFFVYVFCWNGCVFCCCCCWCFGGRSCMRCFDVGFCGIGRNICCFLVFFVFLVRLWCGGYVMICCGLLYKDFCVLFCLGYFECYSVFFFVGICWWIVFVVVLLLLMIWFGLYGVFLLELVGNNIMLFLRNICVVLSRNGGFFLFLFWSVWVFCRKFRVVKRLNFCWFFKSDLMLFLRNVCVIYFWIGVDGCFVLFLVCLLFRVVRGWICCWFCF